MIQDHLTRYFHTSWLVASILTGVFVAYQIGPETIYLEPVVITSGDPVEALKNCGESCSVSGQLLDIDKPNFSDQLGGFDNFFPLSTISRHNLSVNYILEGNIFLEITYPKHFEKVNDITITCENESDPKYSSKKPYQEITSIKSYLINEKVSEYFSCINPKFDFSYNPTMKVEVGPNEYVKFTTQGKDVVVKFNNLSMTLTPDWLTRSSIFLISFFLSLGAGSILYLYLCNTGLIPRNIKEVE